jgi:hypothetical protein
VEGIKMQKTSKINLIDLAGSEDQRTAGSSSGQALKECSNINRSLSALGLCISKLASNSTGKRGAIHGGSEVHIPYRDSVLTWLLKESLGGNAQTIMIAAISPADINIDETLSTLRYANSAKNIKTKATVNVDPIDKLIQSLRAEIGRLKKKLAKGNSNEPAATESTPGASDGMRAKEDLAEAQGQVARLTETKKDRKERWLTTADKRRKSFKSLIGKSLFDSDDDRALTIPHLANLSDDPQFCGTLQYVLPEGETVTVGREDADLAQTIKLAGIGIARNHCIITNQAGRVSVQAIMQSNSTVAHTHVNGLPVGANKGTLLSHGDRLVFGKTAHIYVVVLPQQQLLSPSSPDCDTESITSTDDLESVSENDGLFEEGVPDAFGAGCYHQALREVTLGRAEQKEERRERLGMMVLQKWREPQHRTLFSERLIWTLHLVEEANEIASQMEQALRFRVALSTAVTKAPWSIELRHLVRYDNAELEVIAFSHHSDLSAEQRQKRRHQTRRNLISMIGQVMIDMVDLVHPAVRIGDQVTRVVALAFVASQEAGASESSESNEGNSSVLSVLPTSPPQQQKKAYIEDDFMESAVGGGLMFAGDDTEDNEPDAGDDNAGHDNALFRCSVSEFEEAMVQLREVHAAGAAVAKQATEVTWRCCFSNTVH